MPFRRKTRSAEPAVLLVCGDEASNPARLGVGPRLSGGATLVVWWSFYRCVEQEARREDWSDCGAGRVAVSRTGIDGDWVSWF